MRMPRLLTLSPIALTLVSFGATATVIPVGEFRSVELNHGGHVIVRHGAVQRVSMIEGDLQCTRVRLGNGQRLVIESSGRECRRGYKLQIEVVTPHIAAVSVSNGGRVQTLGAFSGQALIEAAVEQGGTIDIRSIAADTVDASVYSGGTIFTKARKTLAATVESGGVITYWGDVEDVKKSVRDGGAVTRGRAGDVDKPLPEFGPDLPAIPPLPALPAVPSIRDSAR